MVVTLRHHTGGTPVHVYSKRSNAAATADLSKHGERGMVQARQQSRSHRLLVPLGAHLMQPCLTLCLDKPALAHDTHDSKAWHAAAMPAIAMVAMADNHIKTNSVGLQ